VRLPFAFVSNHAVKDVEEFSGSGEEPIAEGAAMWGGGRRPRLRGTADGGTGGPASSITQGDVGAPSAHALAIRADAREYASQQQYPALMPPLSPR
jgi:hypothetical protein